MKKIAISELAVGYRKPSVKRNSVAFTNKATATGS